MHGSGIAIWFFIGVLLVAYGTLICGYGIYEWISSSYPAGVQMTYLHTPVWWGGLLLLIGLFYAIKFRPSRSSR
jgi:hypothetical protein